MKNMVLKTATGIGVLWFLLKQKKEKVPATTDDAGDNNHKFSEESTKDKHPFDPLPINKYADKNPHDEHPFDPLPIEGQPTKPVPENLVKSPVTSGRFIFPIKSGWPHKTVQHPHPVKTFCPFDPIPERPFKDRRYLWFNKK